MLYQVDRLIEETRRIAAEYRRATGQVLPVSGELRETPEGAQWAERIAAANIVGMSGELARHDAARLLGLTLLHNAEQGVDAIDAAQLKYQIKSRVIFNQERGGQRIGQISLEGGWDRLLLVTMDASYQPTAIYQLDREAASAAVGDGSAGRQKRGALSVARIKALATRVWSPT